MKLAELASLIRSKNAGPFILTFDIVFPDDASYLRVKNSGALTIARFAELFRCREEHVQFFECDNARAFKFSIPRPIVQGDLGDGDMHGGQQFIPLMDVEILG
jgi:hypothetical protein